MTRVNYWQKFEEGTYYHLYNRGINGTNLFVEKKNYYFFIKKWEKLIHPFCETIAYCLMPNHFHFIIYIPPITEVDLELIAIQDTSKSRAYMENEIIPFLF